MTFNEKKDQWNTSDPPPNTWRNTFPSPPPQLPIGHFFHPPQYITKKISDPPEYNRPLPPAGNKWLVPKSLTAKLLQQGYRYHKLRKTFSKFYRRHYELVSKFSVGLKTLLHQGLSEPEF